MLTVCCDCQMLENRTKQSRHEMDMIEKLEELKDLNQRQAHVDYDSMLQQYGRQQEAEEQRQEREDEEYIRSGAVPLPSRMSLWSQMSQCFETDCVLFHKRLTMQSIGHRLT